MVTPFAPGPPSSASVRVTGSASPSGRSCSKRGSPPDSWWDQFHAATAHWRRADGTTGWLRARMPGPSDATVEPGRLVLRWHHESGGEPRFEHDRPLGEADPVTLTESAQAETGENEVTIFTLQVR